MRRREDQNRYRDRSLEWQRRSRDRREPRSRERGLYDRPDWRKDERKMYQGVPKIQQKDKIGHQIVAKVNRKETCPFLVRVFYSLNHENVFQINSTLPENQVNLYLWHDSSLRQIGELLRAYLPAIRTKQRFQFWRVFALQDLTTLSKEELGTVMMHRRTQKGQQKYLRASKFKVGDYIDVSIYYK